MTVTVDRPDVDSGEVPRRIKKQFRLRYREPDGTKCYESFNDIEGFGVAVCAAGWFDVLSSDCWFVQSRYVR